MKISDSESLRAGQVTPLAQTQSVTPQNTAAQAYGQGTAPSAQVEFSDQAQTIAAAAVAVNATPDVREDLVAKFKAQVDAGTYHVNSRDIADQMLRRAQADQIR